MAILFPNIPDVPGVPALLRGPLSNIQTIVNRIKLLTSDDLPGLSQLEPPQWGIYLDGDPVVIADSVISLEYRQEWDISTYPVEEGAFQTYNKVQTPFDVRLRFARGGDDIARAELLSSVQDVVDSKELYDVYMPEKIWTSVNFMHQELHRTAVNGVGLLLVDVWGMEVRVTAEVAFSNTQQPEGANPVSNGAVQTVPATQAQTEAVAPATQGQPGF